jgi:ABC-type Fe3+ transport system permease subunit
MPSVRRARGGRARACRRVSERPARKPKRGSMSSVAVFVVAIAVVLLIPIGARGIPSSLDPYGRELPASERKRRIS